MHWSSVALGGVTKPLAGRCRQAISPMICGTPTTRESSSRSPLLLSSDHHRLRRPVPHCLRSPALLRFYTAKTRFGHARVAWVSQIGHVTHGRHSLRNASGGRLPECGDVGQYVESTASL